MSEDQAIAFLRTAVDPACTTWADLGAGSGTFTLALDHLLGFGGVIFAVDHKLDILRKQLSTRYARSKIHLYETDFQKDLPFLPVMDGILLANSLHYVKEQGLFIRQLVANYLRPGGYLVLIEYDREEPNTWIPYPLSPGAWMQVASGAGLSLPEERDRQSSIYEGQDLYVAVCQYFPG